MKKQYPKARRIKKSLRKLEKELGAFLGDSEYDYEDKENQGKLGFWISYYVTGVIRNNNFPKDVWCDGIWWENGMNKFTLSKVNKFKFELACDLDILSDKEQSRGAMLGYFEFSGGFEKFQHYNFEMNIFGSKFSLRSKS